MTVFLAPLVTFLQEYGYPMLWLTTFVAAVGAPLPVALVLLAAGAFSAQGDFNVVVLAAVTTSAMVAGDCTGYLVGRLWGTKVLEWLPYSRVGKHFITPKAIEHSRLFFRQRGGWAIFLTRFLLSALGSVTNLVAGAESFPARTFVLFTVSGEALGAVIPLALGFIAGASWEAIGDLLGDASLVALGVLCVGVFTRRLLLDLHRDKARRNKQSARERHDAPKGEKTLI
jgi:membrane-associated protein